MWYLKAWLTRMRWKVEDRFDEDRERGAVTVQTILIIAVISLPLIALILAFRDTIMSTIQTWWDSITTRSGTP